MKILIANTGIIPVQYYGGTERVIWCLGKELTKMGHDVTFLVQEGSHCDFAKVIILDNTRPVVEQIPAGFDVVHLNFAPSGLDALKAPYIITMHGNVNDQRLMDRNTVFVSKNHAERFGSDSYVHNGLDWSEYASPDFSMKRRYFHFLGKAAWRVKNVRGAIALIKKTSRERLKVLGGVRFNISMGLRFTFSPRVSFVKQTGGREKDQYLNGSKGLVFPVRWHEPFGLAITESLYFGCPVFGTPYGSLPELVSPEVGHLSSDATELARAVENAGTYDARRCHDYAQQYFNSRLMAQRYLEKYEKVCNGNYLNTEPPHLQHIQQEKFLPWSE